MELKPDKGRILISEPFLEDPNFLRTVVLITDYSEEGTVGYVLNQRTDFTVDALLPDLPLINVNVYQGGPVELESFHYLHSYPDIGGAIELAEGLYWSGNFEQVKEGLSSGIYNPAHFKFFIGYSGWAAGQLEMEIEEHTWVVGTVDTSQIFNEDADDLRIWQESMRKLGGDFAILANSPINPQYN